MLNVSLTRLWLEMSELRRDQYRAGGATTKKQTKALNVVSRELMVRGR